MVPRNLILWCIPHYPRSSRIETWSVVVERLSASWKSRNALTTYLLWDYIFRGLCVFPWRGSMEIWQSIDRLSLALTVSTRIEIRKRGKFNRRFSSWPMVLLEICGVEVEEELMFREGEKKGLLYRFFINHQIFLDQSFHAFFMFVTGN